MAMETTAGKMERMARKPANHCGEGRGGEFIDKGLYVYVRERARKMKRIARRYGGELIAVNHCDQPQWLIEPLRYGGELMNHQERMGEFYIECPSQVANHSGGWING
jgi:hypothetical protein